MKIIKKTLYHYLIGVLITASIVFLIIIFDYYFNGYFQYPEFGNFTKVSLIGGLGFGLTHFASTLFEKSEKTNNN